MAPRRVLVLVLPAVNLLDLSGPVQVLSTANHAGGGYEFRFVASRPNRTSAQGLSLGALEAFVDARPDDLVLIPGPDLTVGVEVDPETLEWVRRAGEAGAWFASICTGAIVLGDAGLLDGRRCTSHWSVIERMRQRYPRAHVDDSVLFVRDGRIATSAGVASGIDLALALVEDDLGPAVAARVARELVIYMRRNGDAEQLSPFLARRDHLDPVVHRVQRVLADDFAGVHPLNVLADAVHLSPRGLTKAFVAATGITPLQYQQDLRLAHAEHLLTTTDLPVDEIAAACGYADPRHFRRVFTRRRGAGPRSFRAALPRARPLHH